MSIQYYLKSWPRSIMGKYPAAFVPFYRTFGRHKRLLVSPATDIVIEGFPRSANTFAVVAFEYAQTDAVHIAHHLHVPAQILYAVKRGIPSLVLLRAPDDAVASLLARHPQSPLGAALREYIRFYRAILPISDQLVIGEFYEVTNDFGAVIARVNRKYGTRFKEYRNSPQNKAAVFERIRAIHKEQKETPNQIALPSTDKSDAKNIVMNRLVQGRMAVLLASARECYETLRRQALQRQ